MTSIVDFQPCSCGRGVVEPGGSKYYNGIMHYSDKPCEAPVKVDEDDPSTLHFETFVRKPFVVQAVQITKENIENVAKYVGDLRYKEDGTPYILVDRRLVPNVFRVYPGFFMTKMGENVRCYSQKIFKDQFMLSDDTVQPWLDFLNGNPDDVVVHEA